MFFIVLFGVLALFCMLIVTLGYGIHLLMQPGPRRSIGGALLGAAVALFLLLSNVVAAAPGFDYIDRCMPNGVGGCGNGQQTPDQVRTEIRRDVFVSVLQCVVVPSAVGASIVVFTLRRKDKVRRQTVDLSPQPNILVG